MKKLLVFLVSLLISFQMVVGQNKERAPEAGQPYNEGCDLAKKKKYDEAAAKFLKAIEADNSFQEAQYMMGYCYKKLNNFKKAEGAFKQAISIDSKFEKAYIALANLQSQSDRKSEAINTYNAVLAFNENSSKANYGLGKIYYDSKKYKKAQSHLEKAIQLKSNYVLAYNVLGLTYKHLSKYADASAAFQKAIEKEKKRIKKGGYYYRLGTVLIPLKKYKQAEEALLNAIKCTRSSSIKAASNFYLGDVYKKTGRKQKAIQYYKKAAKTSTWKQAADYEIDILRNPDKYSN